MKFLLDYKTKLYNSCHSAQWPSHKSFILERSFCGNSSNDNECGDSKNRPMPKAQNVWKTRFKMFLSPFFGGKCIMAWYWKLHNFDQKISLLKYHEIFAARGGFCLVYVHIEIWYGLSSSLSVHYISWTNVWRLFFMFILLQTWQEFPSVETMRIDRKVIYECCSKVGKFLWTRISFMKQKRKFKVSKYYLAWNLHEVNLLMFLTV